MDDFTDYDRICLKFGKDTADNLFEFLQDHDNIEDIENSGIDMRTPDGMVTAMLLYFEIEDRLNLGEFKKMFPDYKHEK